MPDLRAVVVYEPDQRVRLGLARSWVVMVSRVLRSRELFQRLFKRDILAASKQSLLGIAWVLLSPLIGIVSWVFMNNAGIIAPGDLDAPYPLFVLIGTTIWGVFMGFFLSAAASLTANSSLVLHTKFSHEILVAQQAAQALIAVVANLAVLAMAFVYFGIWPRWTTLFFPLSLVPLFLMGTGIGMFVAVFSVLIRDITKVVVALLGVLMFVTPVIYSPGVDKEWLQQLMWWNPMTYLVCFPRDLVLSGKIEHVQGYAVAVALAVATFMLSWRLFFVAEQEVVEKL